MSKLTWERCDRVGCKDEPIAYIKMKGNSPFLKQKYWVWVRVCKQDLQAELKDPKAIIIKIRKGFAKLVHTVQSRQNQISGRMKNE